VSEGASPHDGRAVLVLGDAEGLAAALILRLELRGMRVELASSLSDSETSAILAQGWWSAVCVITRDDVLALRLTLLSAHLRPDLPLWVTMFDRTITRELRHVVPAVHVLSPSELVASDLAEQCVAAIGADRAGGRRGTPPIWSTWRSAWPPATSRRGRRWSCAWATARSLRRRTRCCTSAGSATRTRSPPRRS
jgi:hypothetical protein